jgi:DNA repair protein RadC
MAHHIFQLESELQNIPEAAPEASLSFRVSEKLARYGSSALSGLEHLTLLVGKESVALALVRHFGSLKGLARAIEELRQFLPRRSLGCCCCFEHDPFIRATGRTRANSDKENLFVVG